MAGSRPGVAVKVGRCSLLLDALIFDRLVLADGEVTADQQRLLFKVWFFGLFVAEIMPTRMLLLLVGEKGSAKTTALNLVGRLLTGPAFTVGSVPKSRDDFDVVMHRSWLAAFDNVDDHIPWLKDRLAIASTGNRPTKRRLYTDRTEVSTPYKAFVALTSREPKFIRDDVADRLLVLHTGRLDHFRAAHLLYQDIDQRRPELWDEILRTLQRVVRELRRLEKDVDISFRMADYARVGVAIARALGAEDDFCQAIEALKRDQTATLLEHDLVAQCIIEWARNHSEEEGHGC